MPAISTARLELKVMSVMRWRMRAELRATSSCVIGSSWMSTTSHARGAWRIGGQIDGLPL